MRVPAIMIFVLLVVGAAPAAAQTAPPSGMGGMPAAVTIVPPPLNLLGVRDLNFGLVIPGAGPVAIPPTSLQAGEVRVFGVNLLRSITFTVALPSVLTGPGGSTLPLDFNGPYAATCEVTNANVCEVATLQTWNPVATPTHTDTPHDPTSQGRYRYTRISFYLGGRALPAPSQRAGLYSGTAQVTISLN